MAEVTYPPLDTAKLVADGVYVVDSGPLRLLGAPIPVRMTVLRLSDGSLLLHSPTRFSFPLKAELEALGPIRHLVAPNTVHWSFLREWQAHEPEAKVWAAPGLRKRPAVIKAGLRIDHDLTEPARPDWGDTVETVVVRGKAVVEVALFHRPSGTLVLTDLVVNVEAEKLPPLMAIAARLVGSVAPHGHAPAYARVAFRGGGSAAVEAARRLVALAPERVIFSHGKYFEHDGTAQLTRSLSWLLE